MLRRYRPDTDVVLKHNLDYFRGAAKLQRLVYRIIPDVATRRLELKYGGVDISPQLSQLSTLPADDVASFAESGAVDVLSRRSHIVRQLEFNNLKADSPIRDRRVREAMAWAVDYDGLVGQILCGTAERVYGPLPSASWAFDTDLKERAYTHDPGRARRLQLRLDEPVYAQFTAYLAGVFQGNLGVSLRSAQPVLQEIVLRLSATLELTLLATLLAVLLGVPLGIWAAIRCGTWVDHLIRLLSLAGVSTPAFVTALILQTLLSIDLGWLPISGHISPWLIDEPITGLAMLDFLL